MALSPGPYEDSLGSTAVLRLNRRQGCQRSEAKMRIAAIQGSKIDYLSRHCNMSAMPSRLSDLLLAIISLLLFNPEFLSPIQAQIQIPERILVRELHDTIASPNPATKLEGLRKLHYAIPQADSAHGVENLWKNVEELGAKDTDAMVRLAALKCVWKGKPGFEADPEVVASHKRAIREAVDSLETASRFEADRIVALVEFSYPEELIPHKERLMGILTGIFERTSPEIRAKAASVLASHLMLNQGQELIQNPFQPGSTDDSRFRELLLRGCSDESAAVRTPFFKLLADYTILSNVDTPKGWVESLLTGASTGHSPTAKSAAASSLFAIALQASHAATRSQAASALIRWLESSPAPTVWTEFSQLVRSTHPYTRHYHPSLEKPNDVPESALLLARFVRLLQSGDSEAQDASLAVINYISKTFPNSLETEEVQQSFYQQMLLRKDPSTKSFILKMMLASYT